MPDQMTQRQLNIQANLRRAHSRGDGPSRVAALFSCFRKPQQQQEPQKKRKEKKAVTVQDILERLPPSKTPRASEGMELDTCVICLEDIEEGQDAITTQCGHTFHQDCVVQWWTHKSRKVIRCPLCITKQKMKGNADASPKASPETAEGLTGDEAAAAHPDLEAGLADPAQAHGSELPAASPDAAHPDLEAELPASSPSFGTEITTDMSASFESTPTSETSSEPPLCPGIPAAPERCESLESVESV